MNNLFLVEHSYQVKDLLQRGYKETGKWIALGPSAMYELDMEKIPYTIPDDYYDREEVYVKCVEKFDRLKLICEKLDDELLSLNSFLADYNIRPFYFHLWQLAQLIDILTYYSIVLARIFKEYPDSIFYYFMKPEQKWGFYGIGFSDEENIWGRLISLPGWNIKTFSMRDENTKTSYDFKKWMRNTIKYFVKNNNITYSAFMVKRYLLNKNILINVFSKGKSVLVLNDGIREWVPLLRNNFFSEYNILFLNSSNYLIKSDYRGNNNSIDFGRYSFDVIKQLCVDENIDYSPLIAERVFYIAQKAPSYAKDLAKKIENFLKKKRVRFIINAISPDFVSHVLMQTARRLKVQVIKWQHGSVWFKDRITQRVDIEDLIAVDYFLVYGEKVKEAYEKSKSNNNTKIVSLGSLNFAILKNQLCKVSIKNNDRNYRILYVTTHYYRNMWYCSFSPPYMDTLYAKEQMEITKQLEELLDKYPMIDLTIKLPNNLKIPDENYGFKKLNNRQNVDILTSGITFKQLLGTHDIILIDSPTTTLLESLCTRKPIFVLMNAITWPEDAIVNLKKRAVCHKSIKDLFLDIENLLNSGQYLPDCEDNSFLKDYGVTNSYEEIVLQLRDIVNKI